MVSVIVPTYERPEKAVYAINSVIKQRFQDIEIIVVDDNGIGTSKQIATKEAINSIHDNRIQYHAHEKNQGGNVARNTGILQAKGEFVAFLDDDDIWSDSFIENMIPMFENKEIGAVYCDFYSYNGAYSFALKHSDSLSGDVYHEILKGRCPASTSLFIIRKACLIASGMFDPNVKSFQDYDMWLRLSRYCQFAHVPQKLVLKYEGIGEQTSKNPGKRMAGYKYVVNKYEKILNEEELLLFQEFKEKYYYDTLYRCVVYNKKHGLEYKEELREYFKKKKSIIHRVHVLSRLYMPSKMYNWFGMIILRCNKNVLIYKGEFNV